MMIWRICVSHWTRPCFDLKSHLLVMPFAFLPPVYLKSCCFCSATLALYLSCSLGNVVLFFLGDYLVVTNQPLFWTWISDGFNMHSMQQNLTSVSITSMLRSTLNESRGGQFHPLSLFCSRHFVPRSKSFAFPTSPFVRQSFPQATIAGMGI